MADKDTAPAAAVEPAAPPVTMAPEPAPGVITTNLAEKPASREPTFEWMERMVEKANGVTPEASTTPDAATTDTAGLLATDDSSTAGTEGDTTPAPTPGEFDDIIEHLRKQGFQNAQEVRAHAEAVKAENDQRARVEGEGRKLWAEQYQQRVDAGELSYEEAARQWQLEMGRVQDQMVIARYERTMAEATEKREVEEILADPKFASFKETGDEGLDLARVYSELAQVPLRDSAAYFNKLLTAAEERGAARERGKQNAALEKLQANNQAVVPVMGATAAPAGQSAPAGDWLSRKLEQAGLN